MHVHGSAQIYSAIEGERRLERPTRLTTGLILFAFATSHLLNHAFGIRSVAAMEAASGTLLAPWQTDPGLFVLYTSFLVHGLLGLYGLHRRRHLRLPASEAWQLGLGLTIPLLLTPIDANAGIAEAAPSKFAIRPVLVYLAGYFLFGAGYIAYMTFMIAYVRDAGGGAAAQSAFWCLIGLSAFVTPWLWRRVLAMDRGGLSTAIILGVNAVGAALPLLGHSPALLAASALARRGPHDIANALAAAAAAADLGVTDQALRQVLGSFSGLPHRVTPVGQSGGVTFVDDSKATNPHAALAALAGFDSVVLLAGGRNKGLDLGVLRAEAGRIRAVVAIGEAADEVAGCFDGLRPVRRAESMAEAVRVGAELAEPGDTVLLSPACASFDWYSGYAARGDDFAHEVHALLGSRS